MEDAQARGWDVCLGLTPTAARRLGEQLPELERLTGHPVRSEYKLPGEPDVWPPADAIPFTPATFNTVNAWALGLTSSFVVGVVAEGIAKRIPTVTMPCVNAAYVQHPASGIRHPTDRGDAPRRRGDGAVRARRLRTEPAGRAAPRGLPVAPGPGRARGHCQSLPVACSHADHAFTCNACALARRGEHRHPRTVGCRPAVTAGRGGVSAAAGGVGSRSPGGCRHSRLTCAAPSACPCVPGRGDRARRGGRGVPVRAGGGWEEGRAASGAGKRQLTHVRPSPGRCSG